MVARKNIQHINTVKSNKKEKKKKQRASVVGDEFNGQIPLGRPDQTLSETRVYDPGLRQSPVKFARVSDKSADFVWSWTCLFNLDMYGFCPWVWSSRGQSLWVRVVEFRNDTIRPYQRYSYHIMDTFHHLSSSKFRQRSVTFSVLPPNCTQQ